MNRDYDAIGREMAELARESDIISDEVARALDLLDEHAQWLEASEGYPVPQNLREAIRLLRKHLG